jgi:hypothetical protein
MAQLSVADPPLTLVPRRPGPTRPERHRPDHLVADDLHRPVRLERRQRDHQLWGGRLRSHRVHQCTPTLPRPISLPMLRVLLLTSSPGPQRYVSPRRIHTLLRGYHAVSQCERDERAAGVRARPDGQWGVCDPKWVQSSEDRSAQISVHLPPSALPLFPSPGPCLLVRLGASGVTALTASPLQLESRRFDLVISSTPRVRVSGRACSSSPSRRATSRPSTSQRTWMVSVRTTAPSSVHSTSASLPEHGPDYQDYQGYGS